MFGRRRLIWDPRAFRVSLWGRIETDVKLQRNGLSECGDSSPLLLAATRRGESSTADKSAVGKAGASSRTPKIAAARPYRFFGVTAAAIARKAAYRPRLTSPFLCRGEKLGLGTKEGLHAYAYASTSSS